MSQPAPAAESSSAELPAPFDAGFAPDIHRRLADLRRQCPVVQVRGSTGEPTWLVLDHADVRNCLRDRRLSVQRANAPMRSTGRPALTVSLMNYEAGQHARVRRLASEVFSHANIERYRQPIQSAASQLLAPLRAAAPGQPIDLLASFAHPFVLRVLADLYAIEPGDRPEVLASVSSLFRPDPAGADPAATVGKLERYLRARLAGPATGQDALALLKRAWLADGGLDEAELISLAGMLLLAGSHSTAQMIGICAVGLLQYPELAQRLRAQPELAPAAVDELLRWDSSGPFSTPRWAKADIEIGGTVIPAGSRVLMSFLAANHDPNVHQQPERLDVDRPRTARNLAFGFGAHLCPGAPLARLELEIALVEVADLLNGMRLACPPDQLPWAGSDQNRRLACLPLLPIGHRPAQAAAS